MSDPVERIFHDLAVLPVVQPSEGAVRQRRRQRQLRARVTTGLTVVALVAGGTTALAAIQRETARPAGQAAGTSGIVDTPASRSGFPGSFLAVRAPATRGSIEQFDSATGKALSSLTGPGTSSPAVAGGYLYYLKGGSGCAQLLRQPLTSGAARQVPTGKLKGVDQVVSDGRRRLAWVGCTSVGTQVGFSDGRVLHVQDVAGGQARSVTVDVPTFGIGHLAVARDGRLFVSGSTTTTEKDPNGHLDSNGKLMVVGVMHEVAYVVDPARTDRLSAGQRLTTPRGCHFTAAGWHGTDLTAALSCVTGTEATGDIRVTSRLVTVSSATLQITKTIAALGAGDVFGMTVARSGATLAVMGNGAGIGPVPRVVNGSVTLLPGYYKVCVADQPCGEYLETPVWVE